MSKLVLVTLAVLVAFASAAEKAASSSKSTKEDLQTSEARRSYSIGTSYSQSGSSGSDDGYQSSGENGGDTGSYPAPKTKKTVILAIPVKLALQQPSQDRPSYGESSDQGYKSTSYTGSGEQGSKYDSPVSRPSYDDRRTESASYQERPLSSYGNERPSPYDRLSALSSYSERPSSALSSSSYSERPSASSPYSERPSSYDRPSSYERPSNNAIYQPESAYPEKSNGYSASPADEPSYPDSPAPYTGGAQSYENTKPSYGSGEKSSPLPNYPSLQQSLPDSKENYGVDNADVNDVNEPNPYPAVPSLPRPRKRRPASAYTGYDETPLISHKGLSASGLTSDDLAQLEGFGSAGLSKLSAHGLTLDNEAAALAGAYSGSYGGFSEADQLGALGGAYGANPAAAYAALGQNAYAGAGGSYGGDLGALQSLQGAYGAGAGGYGQGHGYGAGVGAYGGAGGYGGAGYGAPASAYGAPAGAYGASGAYPVAQIPNGAIPVSAYGGAPAQTDLYGRPSGLRQASYAPSYAASSYLKVSKYHIT